MDRDLGAQHRTQRAPDAIQFDLGVDLEGHHLTLGMDSGIRSAGNGGRDFDSDDRRQRLFQFTLNGPNAAVTGETMETGPVVTDI